MSVAVVVAVVVVIVVAVVVVVVAVTVVLVVAGGHGRYDCGANAERPQCHWRWAGRQKKAGRQFTQEQMNWLEAIRDYLAANVEIEPADLMRDQPFSDWGGVVAAKDVFGAELKPMLDELGEVLAA